MPAAAVMSWLLTVRKARLVHTGVYWDTTPILGPTPPGLTFTVPVKEALPFPYFPPEKKGGLGG